MAAFEEIDFAVDIGNAPAQLNKLKSLFQDVGTGIDQFLTASAKLAADGKKIEVTLTGINKSFEEVKKVLTVGVRGGVTGLEEVTAASENMATGFSVVLSVAKQLQQQLNDLNASVKTVSQSIADGSAAQITAANAADKAEADLARKRRTRNREIQNLVSQFAGANLGPVDTKSASLTEITRFQSALRNLGRSVADESRLPTGREQALADAFQAVTQNSVQTEGAIGRVQQAALELTLAQENLGAAARKAGELQQAAAEKAAVANERAAAKLAAQNAQQLDAHVKTFRQAQSTDLGNQLRADFIAPTGTSEANAAKLEVRIKRIEEATLAGKVQVQEVTKAFQTYGTTGALVLDNLNAKNAELVRGLIGAKDLLNNQAAARQTAADRKAAISAKDLEAEADAAQAKLVKVLNEANSKAIGNLLRATFQAPVGTDASRLEIPIKRFEEATALGKIQVDGLAVALQTMAQGGQVNFAALDSSTQRFLRSLILVQDKLNQQAATQLGPLADRVLKADSLAANLQQRFSQPVLAAGGSTEKLDQLITKLVLVARDSNIAEQEIRTLFNAVATQGALPSIASSLTKDQQKLLPLITQIQKVFDTEITSLTNAANAEAVYNANVAAGRPILDAFIAQLIAVNGQLKPEKFASVQAAYNRLLAQIGKGNLDVNKLSGAAGGGGGGGGKGLTFLPPDSGGREQSALLQLGNLFKQTGEEGAKAGNKILLSFSNVFRILEVQTIHTFFGQLIADLRQSIDAARQFQIRISEIRTLSQENQLSTTQWAKGLRELSDSFGIPILDVTKAAYDAISNQVTRGAQTFEFLRTVLEFSLVTVSSATDAQNLLASAIQAFGQKNITAARAAESLFKLIDLGRVTAGEISNIFGRVAQLAGEAGLNINELGAALATLTVQGVKPNEAFTLLNNLLLKLIKPSAEMDALLLKLGFSSGQAALNVLRIGGVFRLLNKELESGGLAHIADLLTNIRAIRAAVATSSGDPFAGFENNLKQFQSQTEQFANAVKIVGESAGRELTIQLNQIKNIFTLDFGQDFIASILRLTQPFGGLANLLQTSITLLKDLLNSVNALVSPLVNLSGAFLNLLPGGTLKALSSLVELTTAYFATQRVLLPILTAVTSGLHAAAFAIVTNTLATTFNTTATSGNTLAIIAKTIATGALTLATNLLNAAGGILAIGLTAVTFAYIEARNKSEAFVNTLKEESDAIRKTTEELQAKAREQQRQAAIDQFGANTTAAFENVNNLVADLIKRTNALLDNINKINATGLKGLEESLRSTFPEFDKKLTAFEQAKNILNELEKSQKRVASINADQDIKLFESSLVGLGSEQQNTAILSKVAALRQKIVAIFNEPANIKFISDEGINDIRKTFDEISKILDKYQNQLDGAIKSQQKLIADLRVKSETKAFEDSLVGKDSEQQQRLTIQRVNQLRKQAFDLFGQGDLEEARKKFSEIDTLLNKISQDERGFLEKANKAGLNFGKPLATNNLLRRNEADRLRLEQQLLIQFEQQKQQQDKTRLQNLKDNADDEAEIQDRQLDKLKLLTTETQRLNAAKKIQNDLNQDATNFNSQFNDALKRQADATDDINSKTKELGDSTKKQRENVEENSKLLFGQFIRIPGQKAAEELVKLQDAAKDVKFLANEENIQIFLDQLTEVKRALDLAAKANISGQAQKDTLQGVEAFYLRQILLLEQITKAKQLQLQAERDIATAQAGQQATAKKLGELPQLPGTEPIVQGLLSFNDKFKLQLNELSKSVADLNLILRGVIPGQTKGFALGGSVGSDNTLAWFNKSEFIVNAKSSQQFAPQLRAINMGFEPKFSNSSNQNNVNVGDIHINVQGQASPNLMAREVGEQIRREIRRGTFRGFN